MFITVMNAAVWVLSLIKPEFPALLALRPDLLMAGQFWRAVTFLFVPPALSPFWMFFWFYLLFVYARALEQEWGHARFNLFYGLGALSLLCASLSLGVGLSNMPLNAALFLAFAAVYPDFELLVFFILPVKVKWLAAIAWAGIALNFLMGDGRSRLAVLAGLLNYAVFFGADHWRSLRAFWRRRNR